MKISLLIISAVAFLLAQAPLAMGAGGLDGSYGTDESGRWILGVNHNKTRAESSKRSLWKECSARRSDDFKKKAAATKEAKEEQKRNLLIKREQLNDTRAALKLELSKIPAGMLEGHLMDRRNINKKIAEKNKEITKIDKQITELDNNINSITNILSPFPKD